ncbi:FecCD family ABC transporter permease [Devriesea agamarum]|uniref:FecCD family ABC transporter permease n=1 Tax=Devriesea agamarum TaxID=472569 RepID=UPI00071DA69E|nr:iron ABC transporter permease [Devriesea agamarum]
MKTTAPSALTTGASSDAAHPRRPIGRLAILALLVLITPALTIIVGPASVPLSDVIGVIASHIPGLNVEITWDRITDAIVWQTRLPRIVSGLGVGAVLGVSGVVLQAIIRNPLAEPYVLGVSSGASTGAAIAMIMLGATAGWSVGLFAFGGALIATMLVLLIAGGSRSTALHLILAGLAIGFGFQALTNIIVFSSDNAETSRAVMFWTLGSLARTQWSDALTILVIGLVLALLMAICGPILDALGSGDRTALAVGVNPVKARLLLLIPVSGAVAASVAVAGGIGFVGLIIPHVIRHLLGHSHRVLILGSALAASLFLVWTDAVARIVFAPAELLIGVMTGLIGAPFLLVLIRRLNRGM